MAPQSSWGDNPDILDGPPFQNPPEVPFAWATTRRAIVPELGDVDVPGAHKPSVEVHVSGAIGCRTGSVQNIAERRWRCSHSANSLGLMVAIGIGAEMPSLNLSQFVEGQSDQNT